MMEIEERLTNLEMEEGYIHKRTKSLEIKLLELERDAHLRDDRIASLEKWREELEPIYPWKSLGGKMEIIATKHEDDPQKEKRETPHGLEIKDLTPTELGATVVPNVGTCPMCSLPMIIRENKVVCGRCMPGSDAPGDKALNDNLYNKSHLAHATHLNSEQTELAPARERKDMVFCPECGHKL